MGVWFQITVPLFYINGEVILRLSFTGEEEISWSHVWDFQLNLIIIYNKIYYTILFSPSSHFV